MMFLYPNSLTTFYQNIFAHVLRGFSILIPYG
jgi:hypothetical protein